MSEYFPGYEYREFAPQPEVVLAVPAARSAVVGGLALAGANAAVDGVMSAFLGALGETNHAAGYNRPTSGGVALGAVVAVEPVADNLWSAEQYRFALAA